MSFRVARYLTPALRASVATRGLLATAFRAQGSPSRRGTASQPVTDSPDAKPTNVDAIQEPVIAEPAQPPQEMNSVLTLEPPAPVPVDTPTPWINKEEFEKYMGALYRRGWGIRLLYPSTMVRRPSAELFANYKFSSFTSATNFVQAIGQIALQERHHPRLLAASFRPGAEVALYTLTYSAKPEAEGQKTTPGITIRDLRLAVLADTLYTTKYEDKVPGTRRLAPLSRKPYWDDFLTHINQRGKVKPAPQWKGPPTPKGFAPPEVPPTD